MKYTSSLFLSSETLERVNRLLGIECLEDLSEDELHALGADQDEQEDIGSAVFDDGSCISFELCSGSCNYWLDTFWCNADRSSFVDMEPSFEMQAGVMEFTVNENTYIVLLSVDESDMPAGTQT